MELRAAQRDPSRESVIGCNSPDLSSSGSSSRAGMWDCLMFSGLMVG